MQQTFLRTYSQLAGAIREQIREGHWVESLPGERVLAEHYQVARKTVRAALRELRQEGVIDTRPGAHSQIRLPSRDTRKRERVGRVGLLLPEPLVELRQYTLLWVNKLADLLLRAGYRLEIFSSRKYFVQSGGRALVTLTKGRPMDCWLVGYSSRFLQTWFAAAKIPVVIAGSLHRGITLPSVDVDHLALCRHAAGVLIRAGHRRIALVYPKGSRAGDLESEEGFRQGCQEGSAGITPQFVRHDAGPQALAAATRRLATGTSPVTGLFVTNSYSYLTVVGTLASLGLRIPEDVSVLSRDEDTFLYHTIPVPDRYYANPDSYARQISLALMATILNTPAEPYVKRIMPEYRKGSSIGAPRVGLVK